MEGLGDTDDWFMAVFPVIGEIIDSEENLDRVFQGRVVDPMMGFQLSRDQMLRYICNFYFCVCKWYVMRK